MMRADHWEVCHELVVPVKRSVWSFVVVIQCVRTILVNAALGTLMFGKPLDRGNLNGTCPWLG